jgi:hypothetical protein
MADQATESTSETRPLPAPEAGEGTREPEESTAEFVEQKKKIWKKITDGEDEVGKQMLDGLKDAITTEDDTAPPKGITGNLNRMHRIAEEQVGNIDNPADALKLENTLGEMYRAAQLGEYKVEVSEDIPEDQRVEAARNQMIEDFAHFADKAAQDYFMDKYVTLTVKAERRSQNLQEVTKDKDLSRAKVRGAAFEYRSVDDERARHVEKMITELTPDLDQREQRIADFQKAREKQNEYDDSKYEYTPIGAREMVEEDAAIEQGINNFRQELTDSERTRDAETLDNLDDGLRRNLIGGLEDIDQRLGVKETALEAAAKTNRSETVCDLAREVKALQIEKKTQMAQMEAALATQRREDSWDKMWGTFRNMGESIGTLQSPSEVGKVTSEMKNAVSDYAGSLKSMHAEWAKSKISHLLELKAKAGESIGELTQRIGKGVKGVYEAALGNVGAAIGSRISGVKDRFIAHDAREGAELLNKRLDKKRKKYDKRHEKDKKRKMKKANKAINKGHAKLKRNIWWGRKILWLTRASDEAHEKVAEREEEIATRADELKEKRQRQIEARENPHYAEFEDMLLGKVTLVEAKDEAPAPAEEAEETRAPAEEEGVDDLDSLKERVNETNARVTDEWSKAEAAGEDVPLDQETKQRISSALETSRKAKDALANYINLSIQELDLPDDADLGWVESSNKLLTETSNKLDEMDQQLREDSPVLNLKGRKDLLIEYQNALDALGGAYNELLSDTSVTEEAEPAEEEQEINSSKVRPGARYHELVHGTAKDPRKGTAVHVLYYWDGEKVYTETVDKRGINIVPRMEISSWEANTEEGAKKIIDRQVRGTLRGMNIERRAKLDLSEEEEENVEQ